MHQSAEKQGVELIYYMFDRLIKPQHKFVPHIFRSDLLSSQITGYRLKFSHSALLFLVKESLRCQYTKSTLPASIQREVHSTMKCNANVTDWMVPNIP